MELHYHKKFVKSYDRLPLKLQQKVDEILTRFRKNPFDSVLRNHALRGWLSNRRALSVGGDLRIVFEEYDDYIIVLLLDVGTHAQVYGM